MKSFLTLFLIVAVLGMAFGAGAKETPREITVMTTTDSSDEFLYSLARFKADFPDVVVHTSIIDLSDGSTLTMDAQLAAGTPPNVYQDFIGRAAKYLVPEFALDLTQYVRDLNAYNDGVLAPYTRDGKVLGLPQPGSAAGFGVNMDIVNEVGFVLRDDWTIADFLDLAERVKVYYGGEKYVTSFFARDQTGDYLMNNWFASFGVRYYNAGDYSRTVIRETGGAALYEFIQHLVREGYIAEGSATFDANDYVIHWASDAIAGGAFLPPWVASYFATVRSQGIGDGFEYRFVPFPRAEGVTRVPTYLSSAAIVVHATGTEQDVWAARFAEYLNDAEAQSMMSAVGVAPNRSDAENRSTDPAVLQTAAIADKHGILDVGLTTPIFAATRPQHFPVLQKVLNLSVTPDEAIREYESRLNAVLSGK